MENTIYETSGPVACEYLLLNQPNEESLKQCPIKIQLQNTLYWRHLTSSRAWLYALPNSMSLQVSCPGERNESKD